LEQLRKGTRLPNDHNNPQGLQQSSISAARNPARFEAVPEKSIKDIDPRLRRLVELYSNADLTQREAILEAVEAIVSNPANRVADASELKDSG